MRLKVKDPSRVYYDKEQGRAFTGKKVFEDVKVTGYVRQQLNDSTLIEVAEEKLDEAAKVEAAKVEAAKVEAAKVEAAKNLTPAQIKVAKDKAEAANKKTEMS